VPATFFVLGKHFAGGKESAANKPKYALLDRMQAEGHLVGSHTYEHINHPQFTQDKVKENISKASQLLEGYLNPPVLRLPYGGGAFRSSNATVQAKNDMVMNEVKAAGFKHVLWDIDTNDWDAQKRPFIGQQILKDICRSKGGVVLFHYIQAYTVNNLKTWIQAIKAEGHTFEPLSHFMTLEKKTTTDTAHCEKCQENIINSTTTELVESVEKVIKKADK
jgi:peptidoglycan/xylan/chitin deacetylase (PgdA/CDA1 family)